MSDLPLREPIFPNLNVATAVIAARHSEPGTLFRGEKCYYPHTMSFMDRLLADENIEETVKDELEHLTAFLMKTPLVYANQTFEPQLTAAYLQHYGFPTQMYDFSAHLGVGAYFALNPSSSDVGFILALPPGQRRGLTVRDIRLHPYATRPGVQHAFGVLYNTIDQEQLVDGLFVDLKSLATIEALDLHWYAFYHRADEREVWRQLYSELQTDLENPRHDPYREIAEVLIDRFSDAVGPLSRQARQKLYVTLDPHRSIWQRVRHWLATPGRRPTTRRS